MTQPYLLNAFSGHGSSFQATTKVFSSNAWDELICQGPEAITVAPLGAIDTNFLFLGFKQLSEKVFEKADLLGAHHHGWRFYEQGIHEPALHFRKLIQDERSAFQVLQESLRARAGSINVLVVRHEDGDYVQPRNLDELLQSAISKSIIRTSDRRRVARNHEPSDRERLREAREELLNRVETFTSEDLALGGDSTSDNASQYALNLRNAGKIFGVRFGLIWRYPKFQFDRQRRPLPEMKPVLEALTPDPKGWDRLQWFVTPHEVLKARTPLAVWSSDRQKVIEAAQRERWYGRRD